MSNHSPFPSPPPELVGEWLCSEDYPWGPLEQQSITITANRLQNVATQAAQWGWDQRGAVNEAELQKARDEELEACCELVPGLTDYLRASRRPKPPSLKEQALEALEHILHNSSTELGAETIRRALEQLPN